MKGSWWSASSTTAWGPFATCQIALYVYARFLDLKEGEKLERPVLATNTRLSTDAQRYADCVGMEVLGWDSPPGNGIESIAKKHRLFPVTMMEMRQSDRANCRTRLRSG